MADSAQPPGDADGPATDEPTAADVDLTELDIQERIALATAQQPAIGLFLVLFSLFAFTFFIALALVYPTVAGLFIIVLLVTALIGSGLYFLLR
ncbi:MAG: hypothetical protein U9O06_00550 [Euryarchaeota archaeon]|nr:hypothetical protein [Euryarchaeota archaeon]